MSELFRAIVERLKVIFVANTALEIEAELIASHIENKAALLRQAAQCEQDGYPGLAEELRKYAESMNPRQPATTILPTPLDSPIPALGQASQPLLDRTNGNTLAIPSAVIDKTKGEGNGKESAARKKSR
jgi:hypothetical protein